MSVQSVHYVRISLESPNLYEKLEKKLHIQHFGKVWTFLSQFNRELIRVTRWTSICATLNTDITIIYRYFFHFMSNNFENFETMSGYVWRERVIGSLKVKHVKYFWWLLLLTKSFVMDWRESTVYSFNSNHISTHSRLLLPMPPTSPYTLLQVVIHAPLPILNLALCPFKNLYFQHMDLTSLSLQNLTTIVFDVSPLILVCVGKIWRKMILGLSPL